MVRERALKCDYSIPDVPTREDPWTARTSNQAILREINPKYTLERLMLKLSLQAT